MIIAGLLAMGAAACGDAGDEASGGGPCDVKVSTDTKVKPEITIPDCEKPTVLGTKDIVEGSGAAAKAGDAVGVNYTGISWSTKKQFDSSWAAGRQPYVVKPLGQASVIEGWNKGLVGAKKGGRRLLVIPAAQGYGAQGRQPNIGPNETLVFVVDVVSINGQ
ncbi:peptidyl-prolyl cis-trans isomerase [Rhizocola hellebori]|uniref:Peptidyl-prolyl cis-trans isomerase n=1 Tax=Rhizocola hellebori TaxID=1392758 RepID=A0A8J3VIU5_9ACTN|nr:FKBP-type peptidyl-prolyl cis-trans isomerase [Rhizocola hellebori]GIH08769.1 peptidyl-prolyl cis-trans isomerase [Rhizocola hellebori]